MGKEKTSFVRSLRRMQNERSYILSEIKEISPITEKVICSELSKSTLFNSDKSFTYYILFFYIFQVFLKKGYFYNYIYINI